MKQQSKKLWIAVAAVLAVVIVMVGVWFAFGRQTGTAGEKHLAITVVYADETSKEFKFSTDAEFLRGALEEQNLVAGDEAEFGLWVKTVDGVTADESTQQWWCFTKGGAEVMTGVDSTPIADGDAFEITLKTGY